MHDTLNITSLTFYLMDNPPARANRPIFYFWLDRFKCPLNMVQHIVHV